MQQRKRPQSVSFKNKTEKSEKDPEKFKENTHTHTHTHTHKYLFIENNLEESLGIPCGILETPFTHVSGLHSPAASPWPRRHIKAKQSRSEIEKLKVKEKDNGRNCVYRDTFHRVSCSVSFILSHSGSHVHVVFANIVAFFFSFFQVSLLLLLFLFIY